MTGDCATAGGAGVASHWAKLQAGKICCCLFWTLRSYE
jgi:hypothetical protein